MAVYTSPATPVALTPITRDFYNVNIRDNLVYFRGLLPSPGAAGKLLLANGADTADWLAPGSAGLPLVSDGTGPGYAQLGTAAYGNATVTAAKLSAGAGSNAQLLGMSGGGLAWFNQASLAVGSAGSAGNAAQLGGVAASNYARLDVPVSFVFGPTVGANAMWHAGNFNPATKSDTTHSHTGLDAGTLDGLDSTQFAPSGHSHPPGDATTLDGVDSTGFVRTTAGAGQAITGGTGPVLQVTHTSGSSGLALRLNGSLVVNGDTTATGTKFRRATGRDGSEGYFHAFETPLPMFAEPGRARLVAGEAMVPIDPGFANYVDLSEYEVFLTPHGPAHPYVAEMTPESFTVRARDGDPDISFSWLLVARQGDMTHIRRQLPVEADHG